jgi:uncharacterized protein
MNTTVAQLVEFYQLQPHPEGGYFKETYRSAQRMPASALPDIYGGERAFATAIYFLIEKDNFSAFHRICSDETWHFYTGGPLRVHVLHPDGGYEQLTVGNDFTNGQLFQATVPGGCWFASECAPGVDFSFVGCTVAPGFDFADFELARAADLIKDYPAQVALIERLCRA